MGGTGTLLIPTNARVSDSWQGHRNRTPPSSEPGTDYACAYGTDLVAAESGRVSVVDHSPNGGEGRRVSIDLDNGQRVSYIHLSRITAWIGQRIGRGQRGFAWSGASGFGSDWYYGPHVHVSLWTRPGMAFWDTLDFELFTGTTPAPAPAPDDGEDTEMAIGGFAYTRSTDKVTVRYVVDTTSGFWFEWSDNAIQNAAVARTFGFDPTFAPMTQGGRDVMHAAAQNVRDAHPSGRAAEVSGDE